MKCFGNRFNIFVVLLIHTCILCGQQCTSRINVPIVQTTEGNVSGTTVLDVAGFLGIPFATPPVNEFRFKPPVRHNHWNITRESTHKASPCLQGDFVGSEDCLYLNVFTPLQQLNNTRRELKPVMFYIHGGGFVSGVAPTAWNLTHLTKHVVFTIQYRLGVFGFYSSEPLPSNIGLADQRFALQWVHNNAKAFGGDPNNIMIFGCSAGGASVAGMLVMPEAFGLYRTAALQSPGID